MKPSTKICRLCSASFVPETKEMEYCNICAKIHYKCEKRRKKKLK